MLKHNLPCWVPRAACQPVKTAAKASSALAERVLAAKRADPAADTSAMEWEIDQRVYALYGLTAEEIKLVEERARK